MKGPHLADKPKPYGDVPGKQDGGQKPGNPRTSK